MVSITPQPLYLPEKGLGTHWAGGWVSPRIGLDAMGKKIFLPCTEWTPSPMFSSPQPGRYINWSIPAQQTENFIKFSHFLSTVIP
jgi:hypothetical protein